MTLLHVLLYALYALTAITALASVVELRVARAALREEKRLAFNRRVAEATEAWHEREAARHARANEDRAAVKP